MEIRQAKDLDLPELRQIYYESRLKHFTWLDNSQARFSDFDQATREELVLVAEKEGAILGFLSLYEPDNFIHLLFIKPGEEAKGVGSLLLAELLRGQTRSLSLKCLTRNQNARQFYEKNGFVVTSEGQDSKEGAYYVMVKTSP